ncbi:hypothetical protein J5N97_020070 [Dioscorea zingiberensis]|uniref:Hexosyltransferase n=1 Tax=Dioscorea zingiberensis TaxID=325984 RepID=A0A9D5CF35_9LILI|nr:hypothetical protein J5N97_020070 [Dioscorea zingiberensis]
MGVSPGSLESRHRTSGILDDFNRRKAQKSKVLKEFEKFFGVHPQERSTNCKFRSLKIVLVIIICATLLTFFCSPTVYHTDHALHSGSRFGGVGWIWNKTVSDSRYVSPLIINWTQITKAVEKLDCTDRRLNVGLLNFNSSEVNYWHNLLPNSESTAIHLDSVNSNITWDVLYPEWIDEEQESEVPSCPKLPDPVLPKNSQFDLIAVKLPCNKSGSWSRDVARLHLQLTAAKLAAASLEISEKPVHVLFVTKCFPIPNLFPCRNLITREGNAWLYNPDLKSLTEKLRLPIGSCELALPINAQDRLNTEITHREAYVTILHSAHVYVCGAISAAQSIRLSGSTRDLVILVDESISDYHRNGLEAAGWKVRTIKRIRNPKAERDAYNEWNYSKFRLWQLTDYDKVIFIDADLLILRNIDFLFGMPEITATGNNATLFNSGVMVVEPCNCTFNLLMEHINEIESYNGGDQGYLNEIFTWWHRIPKSMNFLKHFWIGDKEEVKRKKTRLFGADPPALYVLHYLGLKPWLCFRDYDCNWNIDIMQEFASDVAHSRWWKVHDMMPERLQSFCLLNTKQKAGLEWHRREAKKANYSDGHWQRKIKDPRLDVCFESFCDYKRMLLHWGESQETNWSARTSSAISKL